MSISSCRALFVSNSYPYEGKSKGRRNLPSFISMRTHFPKTKQDASNKKTPRRINCMARGEYYDLLEISENGSFEEIKQAYKKMARKYHPDVSPPDRIKENTQTFIRVQEAYETLSNPRTRAIYDKRLQVHLAFSAGKCFDEGLKGMCEWRNHWQDQVTELERRSMSTFFEDKMSWGARMRRKRNESSVA